MIVAKALESDLMVKEIFAVPMREVNLHVETENIMSVRVPKMHAHIDNPHSDLWLSIRHCRSHRMQTVSVLCFCVHSRS